MKRQFKITKNTSKWPLEVLVPLLNLAWDVAWADRDPIAKHPSYSTGSPHNEHFCVYSVTITHCSGVYQGTAWRSRCILRIGHGERQWPMPLRYRRYVDMPEYEAKSWRELIVHLAAHEFAHLTGYDGNRHGEEMCEMVAWDAIDAYRKNQAEIDGKIDGALQRIQDRAVEAGLRRDAVRAERNSAEYRLAALAAKEKVWLRKLRLALTKMKAIKRSRAAILRNHNKKARLEALDRTPSSFASAAKTP